MSNRITSGFKVFTGIVALLVLGFLVNLVVSQIRDHSIASSATQVNAPVSPDKRLIAFTSTDDTGNSDIYTVHPDGSGLTNLTNNPAFEINPFWSPDGTRIAFQSDRDGNLEIYLMKFDGSGLTRLTNDSANDILNDGWSTSQAWSPDGTRILYRNDHNGKWDLFVARTDGSGVAQLTRDGDPAADGGFFWSPDGRKVAYAIGWATDNQPQVYVINTDGSNRKQMPIPKVAFGFELSGWSADGQALYYYASDCAPNNSGDCGFPRTSLYRGALDGSDPVLLATASDNVLGWVIQPNQNVFYFKDKTPFMATTPLGVDDWIWWEVVNGNPTQLNEWSNLQEKCQTPDIDSVQITHTAYADWPGAEKQMLVAVYCGKDDQTWLYLVNADGSKHQLLNSTALPAMGDMLRLSADGRLVLLSRSDSADQTIYVLDLFAAQQNLAVRPVRLTAPNDVQVQPVPFSSTFSVNPAPTPATTPTAQNSLPISKHNLIAFTREEVLYVMQSDGQGQRLLTTGSLSVGSPQWSPDGKQISFQGIENNVIGLYLIGLDGNSPTRLADGGSSAAWSPDGQQIASFVLDYQNPAESRLEIINVDGSNLRTVPLKTVNGELELFNPNVRWSADGKYVQFLVSKFTGGIPYSKSDRWTIYQTSVENGSLEILRESKIPILNWYGNATDLTYITDDEDKNELQWVHNQSILSTWNLPIYTPMVTSWWSTDHHKLLIAMEYGSGTEVQLLLADAGSVDFKQIADHLSFNGYLITPSWSPDGRHIVFSSDLESPGNHDIYTLDIQAALNDPATRPIRLTTSGFREYEPTWQPQP